MLFIFSILSFKIKSPFIFTASLLLLAFYTSLTAGALVSKWLFIAIFMVFLGGMMILFFYMVSLAKPTKSPSLLSSSKLIFLGMIFIPTITTKWCSFNKSILFSLYNYLNFQSLIYLSLILFITLFSVVKISESFKGSLTSAW